MLRRAGSRKKLVAAPTDASPGASSKENEATTPATYKSRSSRTLTSPTTGTGAAATPAEPKRGVSRTSSSSGRLFGRGRSAAPAGEGEGGGAGRSVGRHHSSDLVKMTAGAGEVDANGAAVEYREVMVNGKKKMVRVKKKSAADVAADGAAGEGGGHSHRKLVKVKVVKKAKEPSSSATVDSSGKPNEFNVPFKVGIPANHQLRRPQAPARQQSSDNASGVWSKAARSLFSFHEKRSKASEGEDDCVDLVFQPPEGAYQRSEGGNDLNKSGHSGNQSKASNYKPPTQLNGAPGGDTRSKGGGQGSSPLKASTTPAPKKALKSEFFEKFAGEDEDEYDMDAPPVLEINTNANMTRTKTKSVFQSESMLRRQFIQDQWLSGGSNYIVWEQANQKKLTDSQHTRVTDYMSGGSASTSMGGEGSEFADDVSEISCEELTPPLLLNDPNNRDDHKFDEYFYMDDKEKQQEQQLETWEALCEHRINRFGPRSALTAEAFVNRGMAQLRANQLIDAADSLLSAVCFLEEVHGTMESYNNRDTSNSPAHMHMAQAFFLLGKVYMQQEQYPMAESALFKALNIRQLHLGKSHPDTVECWEQLGMSYVQRALQMEQQQSTLSAAKAAAVQRQAMEILTQVLKLKRAIFGSLHVSVAQTARVVAQLCAMQNQSERAQRLYKQVLNVLNQLDQQYTSQMNPDFPDPRDGYIQKLQKYELADIEEEMKRFGLKEEILEI